MVWITTWKTWPKKLNSYFLITGHGAFNRIAPSSTQDENVAYERSKILKLKG